MSRSMITFVICLCVLCCGDIFAQRDIQATVQQDGKKNSKFKKMFNELYDVYCELQKEGKIDDKDKIVGRSLINSKPKFNYHECAKLYFKCIVQELELPQSIPEISSDETLPSSDKEFIEYLKGYDSELKEKVIGKLEEMQGITSHQVTEEKIKKNRFILAQILGTEGGETLSDYYRKAKEKGNEIRDYRKWYVERRKTPFNENAQTDSGVRNYILHSIMLSNENTQEMIDTAERLNGFMRREWKITVFSDDDVEKRPWYVFGSFFEFISLSSHFKPEDPLFPKLKKFIPEKSPKELFDYTSLLRNECSPKVDDVIRGWLENQFAMDGLQGKTLKELLEVLSQQMEAIQPYHRYLRNQYSEKTPERRFLNRLIHEDLDQ